MKNKSTHAGHITVKEYKHRILYIKTIKEDFQPQIRCKLYGK